MFLASFFCVYFLRLAFAYSVLLTSMLLITFILSCRERYSYLHIKQSQWMLGRGMHGMIVQLLGTSVLYPGFMCLHFKHVASGRKHSIFLLKLCYRERDWQQLKRLIRLEKVR